MRELIVTEEESGQRLDKYLKRKLSYAPMSFFYKMLRKKNIVLNAKKADGSERVKAGDHIRLFLSEETFRKFRYGDAAMAPGLTNDGRLPDFTGINRNEPGQAGRGQQLGHGGVHPGSPGSPGAQSQTTPPAFHYDGTHPGNSRRETRQKTKHEIDVFLEAYRRLSPRIRILYENDHMVAVDKPQGILSQKAENGDFSLNEWVAGYVIQEERKEHLPDEEILLRLREFRPSVCHRLDRNTGGIVICAKTLAGSRVISELIRTRSVRKFYQLVVHGSVQTGGRITTFLSKDHKKNYVRVSPETEPGKSNSKLDTAKTVPFYDTVLDSGSDTNPGGTNPGGDSFSAGPDSPGPDSAKGILAKTVYRPLQTGNAASLIEAELLTGRSHQLRVHFASIGHPIVGDPRYGDREKDRPFRAGFGVRAQLLYCVRIEFPKAVPAPLQDLSGRVISCDVPEVFQKLIASV